MSKQRPSRSVLTKTNRPASYWGRRVFKNTYTRGGRPIAVKRWSVKIQHQGLRRTLSLLARTRAGAAVEAEAICQSIVTHGWDGVTTWKRSSAPGRRGAAGDDLTKSGRAYWRHRLLFRKYTWPVGVDAEGEFSIRIEHAGTICYFPLGTLDADSAAARALAIYQTVVRRGWDVANLRFSRELTVALHWSENPLAWTYGTLHTLLEADPHRTARVSATDPAACRVLIVESDDGIGRALGWCVNHQTGFSCAARLSNTTEALRIMSSHRPHLTLVNQSIPEPGCARFLEQVASRAPGLPLVVFSIHEDSDELFKATPGGASGYLLKRTPPERLLDPVAASGKWPSVSTQGISDSVRQYFSNVVRFLASDPSRDMAPLSPREHQILGLVSKGYVDKEIAGSLGISVWTVHGHLKKIFEKLGVHTRTEAVVKYLHK